jgi:hypothetical protein
MLGDLVVYVLRLVLIETFFVQVFSVCSMRARCFKYIDVVVSGTHSASGPQRDKPFSAIIDTNLNCVSRRGRCETER